ncbi:MAG: trypsin-like serine peptidase, partial [Candidatus Thorarchaeota archaeon]
RRTTVVTLDSQINDMSQFSDLEIYNGVIQKQKVVYGPDNRVEVCDASYKIQALAQSVCGIFYEEDVTDNSDGKTHTLSTIRYGDTVHEISAGRRYPLCPGEEFEDQPVGPVGTAFLVAEDILATAGHIINGQEDPRLLFSKLRFVFNYAIKSGSSIDLIVSNDDVFEAESMIANNLEEDWALLKLKRKTKRPHLAIRRNGIIGHKQEVSVIGHPAGLPMKYADDAYVRNNATQDHFLANLDTFGGSSGSPVFNSDTNIVEGVVLKGQPDYVVVDDCLKAFHCPMSGCRGESCCRVTLFSDEF